MNTVVLAELAKLKQGARSAWAAGDYPEVARLQLWPVGERIVAHAAVRPGESVLDVACGTGNAALRAAQAGADVTGLDLTPELLAAGRRLCCGSTASTSKEATSTGRKIPIRRLQGRLCSMTCPKR